MYEIYEKLLKEKGIKSKTVSDATGIAPSTLSDWKNGKTIPKQDKLKKIADYFDVSVDYLMTGENILIEFSDDSASRLAKMESRLLAYFEKLQALSPEYQKKILDEIDFLSGIENKDK